MPVSLRTVSATLHFNANGGSGAPSSQSKSTHVAYDNSYSIYITVPSEVIPTRDNYNFIGWGRSSSATEPFKQPGDTYSFYFSPSTSDQSSSATIYAVWQLKTYTVSYSANGGTGAPASQTKTHGQSLTLSSTVPTRPGYTFTGWATSSTGAVVYQPGGSYTANADATLYAIWKAATATLNTVTSVTLGTSGGSGTASWTKTSESYRYKLVFSMSGASTYTVPASGYIAAGTSSQSFTIPKAWLNALPNSTSATGTCVLRTYDGDTLIGTTQKTFDIIVNSLIAPSISSKTLTPHSSINVVEGWGIVVQGCSYIHIAVTATSGYGTTIQNLTITGPNINYSGTAMNCDTAVITTSGTLTYNIKVTDGRGRVATTSSTITAYAYANPKVDSLQALRCLSDGTVSDIEGTYIKAKPVFTFSSVNSRNSLTVKKIDYKLHTATSWTTVTSAAVSGSFTSVFGTAAIDKTYDVRCTVTDTIGNSFELVVNVPPVVGFALGLKNDRARFGGPVEKAGLQVDWDAEFNGVVDVTPRRCYSQLSSEGWYRVCKFDFGTYGAAIGAAGGVLHFSIVDSYGTNANDTHTIDLLLAHNKITFANETSAGNHLGVDKIRYTFNSESPYDGFVDIHWAGGSTYIGVTFDYDSIAVNRQANLTAMGLVGVAAAPSGETVKATYTFNANGTGDIKSNGVVEAYGGVTLNSMFYGGTEVPENADFNSITYLTCGVYAVYSSVIADTITNIPVNMAGRLIVVNSNGRNYLSPNGTYCYFIQYYITYTGIVYYRHVYTSGSTDLIFDSWVGISRLDTYGKVLAAQSSSRIVTKTASWTLSSADAGVFFNVSSTSAVTITIPANSTAAIAIGTEIEFLRRNTGAVTFSPASGVALAAIGAARSISDRYGCAVLKKIETNIWVLSGALS